MYSWYSTSISLMKNVVSSKCFYLVGNWVNTTIWMRHMDINKMYGEKAR